MIARTMRLCGTVWSAPFHARVLRALRPGRARVLVVPVIAITLVFAPCLPRAGAQQQRAGPADRQQTDQAASVEIVEVRAGFDGRFKVGAWTLFEITLRSGPEPIEVEVELTAPDGDGVPSRVRSGKVALGPQEQTTVGLFAKIGRLECDVVIAARGPSGLLATRALNTADSPQLAGILPSGRKLIVTLGSPLSAEDEAVLEQRGAAVASVDQVERLPQEWWGYEGVETVIVATGSETNATQLSTDSPQLAALDQWVTMGGKLVLGAGRQAAKVLAPESPLGRLAPGRFETMVPLRQGTALETYVATSEALSADRGPLDLQVPKLTLVRGKIEAYAGSHARDLPLVVRAPHGFGEVVFTAFDLEQPPIVVWPARMQLVDKLLGEAQVRAASDDSATLGQVTTLGFEDISGQLRGALDQFAGVSLVPFWVVAALVLVYIGCIGPLDYYLVKRVFARMETTWLTFAVTVVAFSAGAYVLAGTLKGRELRVKRVDLVDFDASSGLVRGTSWASLFSPKIDTYDLTLVPAKLAERAGSPPRSSGVLLSWMGLPGTGFGGMDSAAGLVPLFTEAYDFSRSLDEMSRVPIAVWSSKAFVGRWWQHAAPPIAAQLADRGRLVGTLTSRLTEPLEECVLFYDRWAYPLRQFKPGQTIDVQIDLDPQRVDTYLRKVTVQGDRNVSAPYDRAGFDIPRIVEIMTVHELAGGEEYTKLVHGSQRFVDLSRLVMGGRAVLVGRAADSAATLNRDANPIDEAASERWTFHRYVFDVEEQASP